MSTYATMTQIVSERNSNGGHVEAMCKWLNSVYHEGGLGRSKGQGSLILESPAHHSGSEIIPKRILGRVSRWQ